MIRLPSTTCLLKSTPGKCIGNTYPAFFTRSRQNSSQKLYTLQKLDHSPSTTTCIYVDLWRRPPTCLGELFLTTHGITTFTTLIVQSVTKCAYITPKLKISTGSGTIPATGTKSFVSWPFFIIFSRVMKQVFQYVYFSCGFFFSSTIKAVNDSLARQYCFESL